MTPDPFATYAPNRTTGIAAAAVDLSKVYGSGDTRVTALDRVSIAFREGEFTAIMGPSGCGKSTLMHCAAGLDAPSSGSVRVGTTELSTLNDRQLTELRRDRIGFIFQAFNLLPTMTALENITLPLAIAGRRPDRQWLDRVVSMLGLSQRLGHRPAQLSGGQQQRVAVARALVSRPAIIFGDEPTGNLDSRAGAEVLGFLRDSVRELGQTVVMVTHDPVAAGYADRVLFLSDGRLADEMTRPTPERVLDRMLRLSGGGDTGGSAAGSRTAGPDARARVN
ncbi:ABC transporter ATP-binding protein [Streptomyces sp. NPDC001407]|uniref:ABC transporter ATP-binding protein n=1 Tax=unclassified Streptomyces TaxID=2593676 RepID=UPI0033F867CB